MTIEPFEKNTKRYEKWFQLNSFAYKSELEAIRSNIPENSLGIEIGVGSGLFSYPLGVKIGIEPSLKMASIAVSRGIWPILGVGESLPIRDNFFDFVLMVTTVCFLSNINRAFQECSRVLKNKGKIIIGFVDKSSKIGQEYNKNKFNSIFYRSAKFYSTAELVKSLKETGFTNFTFTQTLFEDLKSISKTEHYKRGFGEGSFVIINAEKNANDNDILSSLVLLR